MSDFKGLRLSSMYFRVASILPRKTDPTAVTIKDISDFSMQLIFIELLHSSLTGYQSPHRLLLLIL